MSVRLRTPQGQTVYVPDEQATQAIAQGYTRESDDQATTDLTEREKAGEGIGGAVAAGASSLASGATLGVSDVALSSLLSKGDVRGLAESREAHPFITGVGQVAGALATAGAGEASLLGKLPGGYLARAAGEGVEAAKAAGGLRGAAGVLAVSGGEGAIQNGGMYISDIALGDRDLTAEGMAGALGRGFAFGAVAGGATYGLEQGTIAARRLFARTAEGGEQAATDAAGAFDRKTEEVLQAHEDAADIARKRLDEIRTMKAEAQAQKAYAATETADAKLSAFKEQSRVPVESPAVGAPPMAPVEAPAPAATAPTRLEDQLGQMKAQVDAGATLQDLNAQRAARPPVTNPEALLGPEVAAEEQKLTEALGNYEARRAKVNEWIARIKNPRTSVEAEGTAGSIGAGGSPLIRARRSEALAEDVFVEQSGGKIRTIGKGEHSLADITPNSRILARSNGESFSRGAVLDDAYNDAIERARLAESPEAQQAALHDAADIEQQVHRYVRLQKPENGAVIDQIEKVRAEAGRTGYHAAFARAERQAMDQANAVPGRLAKAEPESELVFDREARRLSLEQKATPRTIAEEAHEASDVLGGYEKAAADLTDAVGDAAPAAARDAANGFRQAEQAAEDKQLDRTARAIDDHVQYGPAEQYGPAYRSPKDRLNDARGVKLEVEAKLTRLKAQELEARKAIPTTPRKAPTSSDALKKEVTPAAPAGKLGKVRAIAEKVGGAAELASMAGIPGVPSPHDIPVIGPMLGMYLKFRALTGKLLGRIPATGEARAAALAAETRNKIAVGVDRMLGLAEKAAPRARTAAVATTTRVGEILAKRILDDGQPDAPKGASMQELAAVRMREVAAAAQNPHLVIAEVRKQMAGVTDPSLIAAVEQHQVAKYQYLASTLPPLAPPNILIQKPAVPSMSDTTRFANRLAVADDPHVAIDQVLAGRLTVEAAETLRATSQKLFAEMQQRMLERASEVRDAIPYQQQARMSLLFDVALDRSLQPERLASLQAAHASKAAPTSAPAQQSSPPMPSVAGAVNLTALYQTADDRRAARR